MFSLPTADALNHLLTQNSWALARLARFSGKIAQFDIAPFSFSYTILEDGTLQNSDSSASVDARCSIAPSLLPRLAIRDEKAHAEIDKEGDAALLAEIFFLSRNLRWDAAEDLSRFTGDIASERIVETAKATSQQLCNSVMNFSQAATEYLVEERPLLAKPQHVSAFILQVDTLRDDIARFEHRIKRLSASQSYTEDKKQL